MLNSQTISPQSYIANPKLYPPVAIVPASEYEYNMELLETLQAIKESEADYEAGRFFNNEEVFSELRKRIEVLKANGKVK